MKTKPSLLLSLLFGCVVLSCSARDEPAAPNIVLIVVDTLRADRLSCYGAERDTTPGICRRLAEQGALFERAYAQAPWTLPSMASLLTGLFPDELGYAGSTLYDIPATVPSLAERLSREGYRTAAFVANPTLQADAGFARGFDQFEISEPKIESLSLSAEDQLQPALKRWLKSSVQNDGPFFLWAHYIDPHDPYLNPEIRRGEGFSEAYDGPLRGSDVHGVYLGQVDVPDLETASRQLGALYDSELRYVDRWVSELVDAVQELAGRETFIVLTSDHGEELADHGGWKHGQTLYEEQVRVPLLFRWLGRIEPGQRITETVRLADVAPTLLAAAGGEVEGLQGQDLLPALFGRRGISERAAFFQHLSSGPVRAGAVLGDRKLLLFNASDSTPIGDVQADRLLAIDRQRLPRVARYDLAADPGELLPVQRPVPADAALEREIHRRLLGTFPGTRVVAAGLSATDVLEIEIEVEKPRPGPGPAAGSRTEEQRGAEPSAAVSYFLGAGDTWTDSALGEDRRRVRLRLDAGGEEGLPMRGLVFAGNVLEVKARFAGDRLPVRVGASGAAPIRAGDSLVSKWAPELPETPTVFVFRPAPPGPEGAPAQPIDEVRQRLRSLGYVQ